MRVTSVICLGITIALLAGCASEKRPKNKRQIDPDRAERLYNKFVQRLDFNEDGTVACNDIYVQRARLFNRLDTDESETLTSSEYRLAKFEDKDFLFFDFDRADKNVSKLIELEEFTAISDSEFLSMDKNCDCSISKQEALLAMRENHRAEGKNGGDGKRRGKGKRGGGGRRGISTD